MAKFRFHYYIGTNKYASPDTQDTQIDAIEAAKDSIDASVTQQTDFIIGISSDGNDVWAGAYVKGSRTDNTTDNTTDNKTAKEYALSDFFKTSAGVLTASPKAVQLKHSGDYVELYIPDTFTEVASIQVHTTTVQEEKHEEKGMTGLWSIVTQSGSKPYMADFTIKTGATKRITCKEQYWTQREGTVNERDYIGNVDITVTLRGVTGPDGKDLKVKGATDPDIVMLTWTMYDPEGQQIFTGTENDKGACVHAMEIYATDNKITSWTYKIYDESGALIDTGTHTPKAGEFPWIWVVVAIAGVIITIVIVWYLYSRKASPGPVQPSTPAISGSVPT